MLRGLVVLAGVLSFLSSCHANLSVPTGAKISCEGEGSCPEGLICRNSRCVNSVGLDTTPPDGTVSVSPTLGKAGTVFVFQVTADEPLLEAPELTLELWFTSPNEPVMQTLKCEPSGENVFQCPYTALGTELGGVGGQALASMRLFDVSANQTVRTGIASIALDFIAPRLATPVQPLYSADPLTNPLPIVTQATSGTRVRLTAVADEVLDTSMVPSLIATSGANTLNFTLVPGGFTSGSATFEALIPDALPNGSYLPTLRWTDPAGNLGSVALTPIEVKTSVPELAVDQAQVIYVRSPWGNGSVESLGTFTLPFGPRFELAPRQTSGASTLPASTFLLQGGGAPTRVRVWATASSEGLLGTLLPNTDGTWPRLALAEVDKSAVFASAIDAAGNESPAKKIENAEWVASSGQSFFPNPNRVEATPLSAGSLEQPLSLPTTGLTGADGTAMLARAEANWREVRGDGLRPPARAYGAMAYDSVRGKVVLFGGSQLSGFGKDTWEWDGVRWLDVTPRLGSPRGRVGHALVYDSARGRTVLFGGSGVLNNLFQDTWEWDGARWEERAPAGPRPTARRDAAMAFDSARARVVLNGGEDGITGIQQDTWEWDGIQWRDVTPSGPRPPARARHGLAYDPLRSRTVLFGGTALQDTWEWDGAVWRDVTPAGAKPSASSPLSLLSLAFVGNRVILFGGVNSLGPFDETWSWDGTAWVELIPAGRPPPRFAAAMAWDSARNRLVLFGGGPSRRQDTWEWDGLNWVEASPTATRPTGRTAHAMAWDSDRRRVVMFGGFGNGLLQDTWEWDGQWHDVTPSGPKPSARNDSAMAYDKARRRVVLFGGTTTVQRGDTWEWDGTTWTDVTPATPSPAARRGHALAYVTLGGRNRVLLFGGVDNLGVRKQDTWEWDGTAWANVTPASGIPPARVEHALAFDSVRGRLVLFGGTDLVGRRDDTWEWDGAQWLEITTSTQPSAREQHAMAFDSGRQRVMLVGGLDIAFSQQVDTWEWDGLQWKDVTATPQPTDRFNSTLVYDDLRGRLVLFGGSGPSPTDELWTENLAPTSRPGLRFLTSAGGAGISPSQYVSLRVRAFAGGLFAPYGSADVGATLFGWKTQGPLTRGGEWLAVKPSNGIGVAALQPFLPGPSAVIDWETTDPHQFLLERDNQFAFQLRPSGDTGSGLATVGLDYVELRLRYTP